MVIDPCGERSGAFLYHWKTTGGDSGAAEGLRVLDAAQRLCQCSTTKSNWSLALDLLKFLNWFVSTLLEYIKDYT